MSSPQRRSALLELPGAVPPPDGSPDEGVAWHFGDPLREQRRADTEVVVIDRSNREVLAVTGEERLTWLHTITSQHLLELSEGEHTEALVLDGQGRIEQHVVVSHVDGTVWLDTEPGRAAGLLDYLTKMIFWSKVEVRSAQAERAVLSLVGPSTGHLLATVELPDVIVRPTTSGADLLVPRAALTAVWVALTQAGAAPAGTWAYEALRVAALRPRLGIDTDERTIPHEVSWIGLAVHLNKGCYRGQETVARVANLGRPPRRLLLLHFESDEAAPSTGDPVRVDERRVVGRVGTVARHHELGTIGLALVKYSIDPATPLLAGPDDRLCAAAVDPASVPPENGEPPGRAAQRRLRGADLGGAALGGAN